MSYKAEVLTTGNGGKWATNWLAFATKPEADSYGLDLMSRWTMVEEVRTIESDEPVNYRWDPTTYSIKAVAP